MRYATMVSRNSRSFSSRSRKNRDRGRKRRVVLAAASLLAVVVVSVVYCLFSAPFAPKEFKSTQERDALAADLMRKWQDISAGQTGTARAPMVIDESEVNAFLQSDQRVRSELEAKGVSSVGVALTQGRIALFGRVAFGGLSVPITVYCTPGYDLKGKADLAEVNSMQIGSVNAPGAVTDRVAQAVASEIGSLRGRFGGVQIKVEEGKMFVWQR